MTAHGPTPDGWLFTLRPIPANVSSSCRECGRPGRAWLETHDSPVPAALCASHAHAATLELVERVRGLVVV